MNSTKSNSNNNSSNNNNNIHNSNNNNNNTSTCKHIINYKNEGGCNRFNIVQNYIYSVKMKLLDISQLPTPYCLVCGCFNGRIHICLHCVHAACFKSGHIQQHFKDSNNEHFLAVDFNLNQIYCHLCQDYIYDKEFEEIKDNVKLNITINLQDVKNPSAKRIKYKSWKPSDEEFQFIKKNSDIIDYSNPIIGLRGLNNLGNTCFMNSILQSYIHNPLLRNYFLSDMHKCEKKRIINNSINSDNSNIDNNIYSNGDNGNGDNNNFNVNSNNNNDNNYSNNEDSNIENNNGIHIKQEPIDSDEQQSQSSSQQQQQQQQQTQQQLQQSLLSKICLGCEMDKLYTQVFSGLKIPFTPHHFLYSCWNYSSYLLGYEQQDAHEFFISSLNGIHSHCGGTTGKDCNCIVHCTFGGSLKSEVACTHCQFTSSTSDPFIDISLDIPKSRDLINSNNKTTPTKSEPNNEDNGNSNESIENNDSNSNDGGNGNNSNGIFSGNGYHNVHPSNTLLACLERFTQPEKLDEKYFCRECNCKQESTKQLSFDILPVVICFHLKRFEQSKANRRTHKIDTFIEFPIEIDMTPYTTIARKKSKLQQLQNKQENEDSNDQELNNNGSNSSKKRKNREVIDLEEGSTTASNLEFKDEGNFPSIITDETDSSFIYELFAVVNHTGKIDSGHYTCFVKHHDNWYKCDDSMISSTTINNVLKSKGYLLYYLKKQLEYTK